MNPVPDELTKNFNRIFLAAQKNQSDEMQAQAYERGKLDGKKEQAAEIERLEAENAELRKQAGRGIDEIMTDYFTQADAETAKKESGETDEH